MRLWKFYFSNSTELAVFTFSKEERVLPNWFLWPFDHLGRGTQLVFIIPLTRTTWRRAKHPCPNRGRVRHTKHHTRWAVGNWVIFVSFNITISVLQDGQVTVEEFKQGVQSVCMGKKFEQFPESLKHAINCKFQDTDLNGMFTTSTVFSQNLYESQQQ